MFQTVITWFSLYLGIGQARERGGVSEGIGTQVAHAGFYPGQLKNRSFCNSFFYTMVS